MRSHVFLIAILTLLPMLPASGLAAVAPEPVARIAALRSQATAIDASGVERTLQVRSALFKGDTIATGKKGRLQILFNDNTIISLGSQTTFIIKEYLWQPDKQTGEFRSEVKEGLFRVMGGKLTKAAPQNFTTKTPAATIGIRGSMYAGMVSGDSLSVVFQGGRGIVVTNQFGSVEIPKPGFGTHVRAHAAPPPPKPFSGANMDAFTAGFNGAADDDGSAEDDGSTDTPSQEEPEAETEAAIEETVVVLDVPALPPPHGQCPHPRHGDSVDTAH